MAQRENVSGDFDFYFNLGIKDAKYELSLESVNSEDEKDFWMDQLAFENQLKKDKPKEHQFYLNGKGKIYRQHQIHCVGRCDYSEQFAKQIAYYIINGQVSTEEDMAYAQKTKKSSQKE